MRLRAALASAGIAVLAVSALSGPAQAAAPQTPAHGPDGKYWVHSYYTSKALCQEAGREIKQEEHYTDWYCRDRGYYPNWALWVKK